jgi:hypothetical protein
VAAERDVIAARAEAAAEGTVLSRSGNADGHPHALRYTWRRAPAPGLGAATTGFDFLLLDAGGRIVRAYRFPHRSGVATPRPAFPGAA